jgi:hypothetical protein
VTWRAASERRQPFASRLPLPSVSTRVYMWYGADSRSEDGAVIILPPFDLSGHLARERSRSSMRRKKEAVKADRGDLACEICRFDLAKAYPSLGDHSCEVHHEVSLASGGGERESTPGSGWNGQTAKHL